jgi:hypothetical protein
MSRRMPLKKGAIVKADAFAGIKAAFGIPASRALDLSAPMRADVGRLGNDEEGLRLTLAIGSPYEFNAEVKLSRGDAEWLVARLRAELDDPRNVNLPLGTGAQKADAAKTFLDQVGVYLRAIGWKPLVAGGIAVAQPRGDRKMNFQLIVDFTGAQPAGKEPNK